MKATTTLAMVLLLLPAGCGDGGDHRGATDPATVSVANLNILHGFDCDPPTPADGDQCRVRERVDLLLQHLVASGCPDLVTLQEIVNREYVQRSPTEQAGPLDSLLELIRARLPALREECGFTYELLYLPFLTAAVAETDEELVLSRYPVLQAATQALHSALYDVPGGYQIFARHVLHARIDHPAGEVDVYTTHLSSGSDAASNDCDSFRELLPDLGIGPRVPCPPECDPGDTVRACQAEQLALYVEQTRAPQGLALVTGDFNAEPGSSEYLSMTRRGWQDSHLAAGAPECNATTGTGCTSGRASDPASLDKPALQVDRRIDYIFVAPPADDRGCQVNAGDDRRGYFRLVNAGLFAAEPNPFASCGAAPSPPCWVSDHSGNRAQVACLP